MFPGGTSSAGQEPHTPATPDQTRDSDQKSAGPIRPPAYQLGVPCPHSDKGVGSAALGSAASSCYHSPAGSEAGSDAGCEDLSGAQRSDIPGSNVVLSQAASGSPARPSLSEAARIKGLYFAGVRGEQPVPIQHLGLDAALANAAAVPAGEQSSLYLPTSKISRTPVVGGGSMQIGGSDYRAFLDAMTAARQSRHSPQRAQQPDADQQSTPAARSSSSELYVT